MAAYYVKSGVATIWAATTAYVLGNRVSPTLTYGTGAAKGRVYECTTAGTSDAAQPAWNTTVGGTTNDGTVVWTTRDITSWANASPYLHYANNYRNNGSLGSGDTIYVSNNHAESVAQTDNFNSSGFTDPTRILCANDAATPPTALATGATVTITSSSSINFLGFLYSYGISYVVGSGQSGGGQDIILGSNQACKQTFEAGTFTLANTGAFCALVMGSTAGVGQELTLNNMKVSFGAVSHRIICFNSFLWKNTPTAIQGTVPTYVFYAYGAGNVVVDGVDLSAATNKMMEPASGGPTKYFFQNCKTNANFVTNFLNSTLSQPGSATASAQSFGSGATPYNIYEVNYYGSLLTETTLVRTSGASDGTTTVSWKMTTGSTTTFLVGVESPWISQWQNTTGAAKTATIEILHDSVTALTNADIYAEVEYFASTNPGTSFTNNRATDILATPVAHTTSAATWTTTGMANPNKQYLQVSFTPGMVGPIRVKVYLLKASYTVYIDPLITIA